VSWANLDDRLHAHPKIRRLQRVPFAGAEALGIWTWCLSWCRAYAPTTGKVSLETVALDWNMDTLHMTEVFGLLCLVGLVDEEASHSGEYLIHDWTDWQLNQHAVAGKARAASADRTPGGQFAPRTASALEPMASAGSQRATPLHSIPNHATPARARDADGFEAVRDTVRKLGFGAPEDTEP